MRTPEWHRERAEELFTIGENCVCLTIRNIYFKLSAQSIRNAKEEERWLKLLEIQNHQEP